MVVLRHHQGCELRLPLGICRRIAQGRRQKRAAKAASARGGAQVQILHIKPHLPAPAAVFGEIQDQAQRRIAGRQDHPEPGQGAKAMRHQAVRGAPDRPALGCGHGAQKVMDHRHIAGIGAAQGGRVRLIGQNATASAPLSASIARASAGVATTRPRRSTISRIRVTCCALLWARTPFARYSESSSPTRT